MLLSGCIQSRYMTEKYIKSNIEQHTEGDFSSIKTYSIFKGKTYGGVAYLELTGYKYNSSKGLIIGADRYYLERQKFRGDKTVIAEITYIELTKQQCIDIVTNYKILQDKLKSEKPRASEEIYHDYTVSKDLYISYRKSSVSSSTTFINFWIKGEKYPIATSTIIKKLEKFINY